MFLVLVLISFLVISKIITVLTNFQCITNTCLVGKVVIVTGGNSGIGLETAFNLASRGCQLIIANRTNGENIVAKIKEETGNQNIKWKYIDLGSLASVREFAADILKTENRLDLLINNAGTAECNDFTQDGLKRVMQVNYFGHFLLTHLLVDLLKRTAKSRVVNISSILAFTYRLDTPKQINTDVEISNKLLKMIFTYGNSKICILIATKLMAEKLKKHGILCYSLHPGLTYTVIYKNCLENSVMQNIIQTVYTILAKTFLQIFGKTVNESIQTTLHCSLSKEVEDLSGKYFCNGAVFWEPPLANNREFCLQVWEETEKLVKLTDDEKLD